MTEIKDSTALNAEIRRLEAAVRFKEQQLRSHITGLRESMKPRNIFSSAYQKITGEEPPPGGRAFTAKTIKNGLSLWLSKLLFKTEEKVEQQVYDAVDTVFDRLKGFLERKKTGNG
jgi:hypothetical protein